MSGAYWTETLLKKVAEEIDKAYANEAVAAPNTDLVNLIQPLNRSGFPVPLGESAKLWTGKVALTEGVRIVLAAHIRVQRHQGPPVPLKAPNLTRVDHLEEVKKKERDPNTTATTDAVMPLVTALETRWEANAASFRYGTDLLALGMENELLRLELQGLEQYGKHLVVVVFTLEVPEEVRQLHESVLQAHGNKEKLFAAVLKSEQAALELRRAETVEEQDNIRQKQERLDVRVAKLEATSASDPAERSRAKDLRLCRRKLEENLRRSQNEPDPGWCLKTPPTALASIAQLLRIRKGWPYLFSRLKDVAELE